MTPDPDNAILPTMANSISRRSLLAAAGAGAATSAFAGFPNVVIQSPVKPVVISSANGNTFKNGGAETCVVRAFEHMMSGADVLDALIAGVNINELDPEDLSVGYGGIPNADGVVQLDACCMHGPTRRAGGVAALEGVRTPSLVAKAVMDNTDNHLLVGAGAQQFARNMGFTIEADLNSDRSRRAWLEWKRRTDREHYPSKEDREEVSHQALLSMARDGWIDPQHVWGTINCNGINAKGEISGVTTTSGLGFKIPGRVGDSPILGAGLYVDGSVGAAGSTGRGEANLYNLTSYLIVEGLRRGMHPKDAGIDALKRVASNTVEKRLLNAKGQPNFGLQFYILDARGQYAGVALQRDGAHFAVCSANGPEFVQSEGLF
jgi:N4-(beta-N-acetylglucosaminyl)-L-asparaginase